MYSAELREMLKTAFAAEHRGHVTRDSVVARLKRRSDVLQAMAAHHRLPALLLKKITNCIRPMAAPAAAATAAAETAATATARGERE